MGIHRRVVWMVDGWVLFHEVWRGNVIRDISARLAEEVAERVWSTSWDMSFLVFSYFGVLGSWIHRFWGLSVGDASAGKDCMLLTKKKCLKLLGLEPFLRGSCVKRLKRGSTESQLGPKCNKFSDCLMQFRWTTKWKFAKRPFLQIDFGSASLRRDDRPATSPAVLEGFIIFVCVF